MTTAKGASITITPVDDLLVTRLREFVDGGGDTTSLMGRIGSRFVDNTQERFETQTDPEGRQWKEYAPLSPGYIKRKKQNKDKILTLSGYLRRFIHHDPLSANEVAWGSNLPYAAIHQLGGVIAQAPQSRLTRFRKDGSRTLFANKKNMQSERWVTRNGHEAEVPARPYLGVSVADNQEALEIIQDWLHRTLNGLPD